MGHKGSTRRLFLHTAGVASTVLIAGCSGDDSDGSSSSDDSTDDGSSSDSSVASSNDESAGEEESSLFSNYGIDGTDLSIELTEDGLSQVEQIRVETPSGQKTTEVGESITKYSVEILRDRAGTWFIDALDANEEAIETVELETAFSVSVEEIGTLTQLGVTGRSPDAEEVNLQLTLANTGDVPVEVEEIHVNVPEFEYKHDTFGGYGTSDDSRLVDRDGEEIIIAGMDNTYRYYTNGGTDRALLIFSTRRPNRANEVLGQSFQGEFVIRYQAQRQDTVVPITIDMGDEVAEDPEFSAVTSDSYIRGTVINKR